MPLGSPCFRRTRNQTSKFQFKSVFLGKTISRDQFKTNLNQQNKHIQTRLDPKSGIPRVSLLKKQKELQTRSLTSLITIACRLLSFLGTLNKLRSRLLLRNSLTAYVDSQTECNIVKLIVAGSIERLENR